MRFGHEKLDVFRLSIDYVAWAYSLTKRLKGADGHARDQLLRASRSISQNIAEGGIAFPSLSSAASFRC